MQVENLFLEWFGASREELEAAGYRCRLREDVSGGRAFAADLDGPGFLGTICHWPPDLFEFNFIAAESGDEIELTTVNLESEVELATFVAALLIRLNKPR